METFSSQAEAPNKIGRVSRRCASLLNAGPQFGRAVQGPPFLSAAVGHRAVTHIVIGQSPTELVGYFAYGLFSDSVSPTPAPRCCGRGIHFDPSPDFVVAWTYYFYELLQGITTQRVPISS